MKGRSVIAVFILILLLPACDKENIQPGLQNAVANGQAKKEIQDRSSVYVSNWDTISISDMRKKMQGNSFSFATTIPSTRANVEEATILLFARDLWDEDPAFAVEDGDEEPLSLPFYFLPYSEQPGYTERWDFETTGNKIEVGLTIGNFDKPARPAKKIEVQYIIIPHEILSQKRYSEQDVLNMSYRKLIETFRIPF